MPSISPSVQAILDDLYEVDPALQEQEAQLIPIIERLLALRPRAEFNPSIRASIREELLAAHEARQPARTKTFQHIMNYSLLFKRALWPLGALAATVLVLAFLPFWSPRSNEPSSPKVASIESLPERAFGQLALQGGATQGLGLGGGGGRGLPSETSALRIQTDEKMIAPPSELTRVKYVYAGEMPSFDEAMDVYRRVKGESQKGALVKTLSDAARDLLALDQTDNARLQSFTVNEEKPFGMSIMVDFAESMVNLNQYYATWPHPESACRDEACFRALQLKPSDMPADEEIIRIANDFLKAYGISTERYQAPTLNKDWLRSYELAQDKTSVYVPDSVAVVYPLAFDGKAVIDEGGYPYGLYVGVNVRQRRVDNVGNLTTNVYQRSAYAMETDEQRLRALIERGGVYGFVEPNAERTVEVELSEPVLMYQKVWTAGEAGRPMSELFVPALRFSVKNKPQDVYVQDTVIIPLAKDILDQQEKNRGDVRIMSAE